MEAITKQFQNLSLREGQGSILIVKNKATLLHKSSRQHPETPARIEAIITHLTSLEKYPKVKIMEVEEAINAKEVGALSDEEVRGLIIATHGEGYLDFVEGMWHEGIKKPQMYINTDTYFMRDTFRAAFQAVRSTLIGVRQMAAKRCSHVFSVVRPPGHHSGMKSQPHGFSFFNNLGVAVNYLISKNKCKKIAIVDWDVHHGEGTQKLFYNRKDVLFISIHRHDQGKFFPHIKQSASQNVGEKEGEGYNVNICWDLPEKKKGQEYNPQETCGDTEYIQCFRRLVLPILREFSADAVLISCGFDSGDGDPIGSLKISKFGYMHMVRELMGLGKPLALILEGGYNLEVLKWASEAVVSALCSQISKEDSQFLSNLSVDSKPNKVGSEGIQRSFQIMRKYWKL